MSELAIIIMAAGKGTRMLSDLPKVLHELNGRALIELVVRTAKVLSPVKIVVIVGHQRELVERRLAGVGVAFAVQDPPLGTGHAIMCAEPALAEFAGTACVLSGDVPLLRASTVKKLIEFHNRAGAAATVLTTIAPDPSGYGRVLRSDKGEFERIVEERDASPDERRVSEINSGVYCFEWKDLVPALKQVRPNNAKGEYYLTDVIGILGRLGHTVQAANLAEYREVCGINTQEELRDAERYAAGRPGAAADA